MMPPKSMSWALGLACLITLACREEQAASGTESSAKTAVPKAPAVEVGPLQPSLDSLVQGFFRALISGDTSAALRLIPTREEYEAIYPHLPDADSNPNSAVFIAQLYTSGNRKHLNRWLSEASGGGLRLSRYTVEGEPEITPAFELIRGVRIWVADSTGRERGFPVFQTILKMPGGYKIWSLLDT